MNNFLFKIGFSLYFVGMPQSVMAQQNYEYQAWFDANTSNWSTGTVSDTTQLANLQFDIRDLSAGYHQVQIRFKRDTSPIWSSVVKRVFYKYPTEQPIAEAEYWWDQDWSTEYSLNLNAFESNQIIPKSLNINHLSNGLHKLHIRYRGKAGSSSLNTQYFYKVAADTIWKIQQLEYWFDADLMNLRTLPMTYVDSMRKQIATTGLSNGLHQLHLRWVGSAGHTSVVTYPFYKADDEGYWVTELHYWFDDNINAINRLPISNFSNDSLILNRLNVTNLAKGRHRVTIQYGGKAGWSSPQTRWFYKPEAEGIAYWFYQRNVAFADTLRGFVPADTFQAVAGTDKNLYLQAKVPCDGWYQMATRSKTALGWSSVAERDSIFLKAPFTVSQVKITHTTCGEDTGKVVISPPRFGNNWQYALLNLSLPSQVTPFQSDTIFRGLKGNTRYTLRVRDASGCEMSEDISIAKNALPQKDTSITVCDKYRWIDTILDNNGIRIMNDSLTTTGVYRRTLKSRRYANCDSIVNLHLTVYRNKTTNIDTTICELGTFQFGNRLVDRDSTYKDSLHTWKGCDSIVTLRLRVRHLPRDLIRDTICAGTTRRFGTQTLSQAGTYRDTIHRIGHCDSLVTLILSVQGRRRLTQWNKQCEGDTIKLVRPNDTFYIHKDTTVFTRQFRGCDSIFNHYEFVPKPSLTQPLIVEPRCLYSRTGRISISLNRVRQDLQWEWLKRDTIFPIPTDTVWSNGFKSLIISHLDTGHYLMRIMDNQICKDTLLLPVLLDYRKFRIDSTKACKGSANGTAQFVYDTKPNYYYRWAPNQQYSPIDKIVHLRAGSYVVTVMDDYNSASPKLCDSVRFRIPEVDTSINYRQYTICYGDTLRVHDTIFTTKYQSHRMMVKRHDGLECDSIIFVTVNMRNSDPNFHLNASPRDTTILLGDSLTLKIAPNFQPIGIDWDPNKEVSCPSCPLLISAPVKDQAYSIKAQNDKKCWMQDSILVRVKRELYTIPNAFYPTEDYPLYTIHPDKAIAQILKLTILDRWGKRLYQSEGAFKSGISGWDGMVGGINMPQDVYRAIVEIRLKDGSIEIKNQAFTLFR